MFTLTLTPKQFGTLTFALELARSETFSLENKESINSVLETVDRARQERTTEIKLSAPLEALIKASPRLQKCSIA